MSPKTIPKKRTKFLFVNGFSKYQYSAVQRYSEQKGMIFEAILLIDDKYVLADWQQEALHLTIVRTDFQDNFELMRSIRPFADEVLAVTCLGDGNIPFLKKVIPFVPACNAPTETSLEWTTEKTKMRRILREYDQSIAPHSLVIHDSEKETIDAIEKEVGFPLVVKPSGLAASLLVSICYHREELETVLNTTIRKIHQIYKKKAGAR